ncbi:hypothetical protein QWY31_05490 [Cytophagales bacterium LB-30]|uniref:Outer membrane protein beta-barrel domain-containing protein n=2 Tax=Shiella aurantiaca TaxID=3058365 RepID=A0ABT8F3K2_9BACT|nr:hypothetical protein [Shiella aurantiaca]
MKRLLLFILLTIPFLTQAQKRNGKAIRYAYVAPSAFSYAGDLGKSFTTYSAGMQVGVRLNHRKKLNGGINLLGGYLSTRSNPLETRNNSANTSFQTSLIGIGFDLHYSFIKTKTWQVYVSQGFGILRYQPKDENGNPLQEQNSTRSANETYGNSSAMLPTQVGANYFFKNTMGVGLQIGLLNPQTDYLDNVSLFGNPENNDKALSIRLMLIISIFEKEEEEY